MPNWFSMKARQGTGKRTPAWSARADAGCVRRANVVTQIALDRLDLQVHTTLADTISVSRAALRASR